MAFKGMRVLLGNGDVNPKYLQMQDPRDRFLYITEELVLQQKNDEVSPDLIAELTAERWAMRARATMLYPLWDATSNLSVADLEGRRILFSPNPVQKMMLMAIEEARVRSRAIKLLVPKSRRHGVSEGASKWIYPFTARRKNVKSMVVAHTDEDAANLFEDKYKFVHRHDPFKPTAGRSNKGELFFKDMNSSIQVRSAGGRMGVGRGSGHVGLHLSECAFYPGTPKDVAGLISSLIAGMPRMIKHNDGSMDEVFTVVIAESTGNGQQGWFYEKCMRAWNNEEGRVEGESGDDSVLKGWTLMFFPWFQRWNAYIPFLDGVDKESVEYRLEVERFLKSLDEEEQELFTEYELSPEQLLWRRRTFQEEIEGVTEDERRRMMRQEHPSTLIQCFQPAGGMAFPIEKVDSCLKKAPQWELKGRLYSPIKLYNDDTHEIVPNTPPPNVFEDPKGWYEELEPPIDGEEYAIGVDLAKGSIAGDWSAASVWSRTQRKFVARIRAKLGPEGMVDPIRLLHRRYNRGWVCIEENYGAICIDLLKKTDVRERMYWRKGQRSSAGNQFLLNYGFNTNKYSKKHLVDLTNWVFEEDTEGFTDPVALREMLTFEQALTPGGEVHYPGAPPNSGVYDDVLMSEMLALVCDHDMVQPVRKIVLDPRAPSGPPRGESRALQDRLNEMADAEPEQEELEEW